MRERSAQEERRTAKPSLRLAQGDAPSEADLMFRAMTSDGRSSSSKEDGLSDNEKIDRALREAAIEAHKKKVKLRQAAKFWKDPFSEEPDKPVAVNRPQPSASGGGDLATTKRELAKAREETATAKAEAAAARAEAARANAARARAEANAAYVAAVAAKREAQAARVSCDEARLAKAAAARTTRPRDPTRASLDGLVPSGHRERVPSATPQEKPLEKATKVAAASPPPAPNMSTPPATTPAPPPPSGSSSAGDSASSRAWRNGIVVVPLSSAPH